MLAAAAESNRRAAHESAQGSRASCVQVLRGDLLLRVIFEQQAPRCRADLTRYQVARSRFISSLLSSRTSRLACHFACKRRIRVWAQRLLEDSAHEGEKDTMQQRSRE